jgi:hypothetical protein
MPCRSPCSTAAAKTSQSNYSRSGILEAYEAAFAQIGNNLLADLQLLERIKTTGRQ